VFSLVRIAAIQALPRKTLVDPKNVEHALELLERASRENIVIACFPELYPYTGLKELCDKAEELGIYVIAGIDERTKDGEYNTAVLIGPDGEIIGRQRKIHVVPFVESNYKAGKGFKLFRTKFGRIGILVCIDFWGFPEGAYKLVKAGVDIIFNPCLTFRKKPQRRMSCISRVLDYKIPIVSVSNAKWSLKITEGSPELPPEGGGSLILSPPPLKDERDVEMWVKKSISCEEWIVREAGEGEEIMTADINLEKLKLSRKIWDRCLGKSML